MLPKGSGKLRQRVTLRRPVRATPDSGGTVTTYEDVAEVWAWVAPASGSEPVGSQQVQAGGTSKVVIRHHPGVAPDWQLGLGARDLNVLDVADYEERREYLTLTCAEYKP